MGFFGKIKENMNHGGVKVELQAPASVSETDATLPVTVNVTATDKPENIKSVKVQIIRQSHNQSFSTGNINQGMQNQEFTVAQAEDVQPFSISPGETKTVQLSITMNAGTALGAQLPEGSGMSAVAGALEKLQEVSEVMNQNSYSYYIHASAQIDGIAIGPGSRQPLQILKPGQIGGAVNFKL
jgi:uncharacterized membrane protein